MNKIIGINTPVTEEQHVDIHSAKTYYEDAGNRYLDEANNLEPTGNDALDSLVRATKLDTAALLLEKASEIATRNHGPNRAAHQLGARALHNS